MNCVAWKFLVHEARITTYPKRIEKKLDIKKIQVNGSTNSVDAASEFS